MGLKGEISEQPAVLRGLLEDQMDHISRIVTEIHSRKIHYVFLTARGSSDHAGLYAKYLWCSANQLPVALAAPSLFSIYRKPPKLDRALVVAISQSGQSPDILSVVQEGKEQGAPTLAITNDPGSPLATLSTARHFAVKRRGSFSPIVSVYCPALWRWIYVETASISICWTQEWIRSRSCADWSGQWPGRIPNPL